MNSFTPSSSNPSSSISFSQSSQFLKQQEAAQRIIKATAPLIGDFLPDAHFIVGGAFRFDCHLHILLDSITRLVPQRYMKQVMGTMPCNWSLDWLRQGERLSDYEYRENLIQYAKKGQSVSLCFDNPFIPASQLGDTYGMGLINELLSRNGQQLHSVSVAQDELRDALRSSYPHLKFVAHANRVIAAQEKRNALFYNRLAEGYTKLTLHPSDAGKWDILQQLENKDKYIIIVNDPCLKTCPLRRKHLQVLAQWRQEPFNSEHRLAISRLLQNVGCKDIKNLISGQSSNLSTEQMRRLYDLGFRYFAFQDQTFVSVMNLIMDVLNGIFIKGESSSHLVSTIQNKILSIFSEQDPGSKSGMGDFS